MFSQFPCGFSAGFHVGSIRKEHKVMPHDQVVIAPFGKRFISCGRAAERQKGKTVDLSCELVVLVISGEWGQCVQAVDDTIDVGLGFFVYDNLMPGLPRVNGIKTCGLCRSAS